jgi:hypothetical protein
MMYSRYEESEGTEVNQLLLAPVRERHIRGSGDGADEKDE